jgi:hypothetical protein
VLFVLLYADDLYEAQCGLEEVVEQMTKLTPVWSTRRERETKLDWGIRLGRNVDRRRTPAMGRSPTWKQSMERLA